MVEGELEGVQEESPRSEALVRRPVAGVPDHGVPDGRHVHADLMRPPALERELEQGRRLLPAPPLQDRVGGARRFSRGGDRHLRRRAGGAADGRLHLAPVVGHVARDQGQVAALHGPGRQLVDQRPVGLLGPGHGQEARGALVEAVHDPGPVGRAHARRHQLGQVGEAGQETADQGPLVVPGARVHHQPGRLVHDDHRVVGVDDLEAHAGLGRHARVPGRRQPDREGGALTEHHPAHRDGRAVDQDASLRDQLGGRAPRDVGHHGDARSTRTPASSAGTSVEMVSSRPCGAASPRLAAASSAFGGPEPGPRRAARR